MAFTPRTSKYSPSDMCWYGSVSGSNKYWYSSEYNTVANNLCLPNCTTYAWGRSQEIAGFSFGKNTVFPNNTNFPEASNWYNNATWEKGSTPKLGAVACWNGSNHVAVVEKIDGGIYLSMSGWVGASSGTRSFTNPGESSEWYFKYVSYEQAVNWYGTPTGYLYNPYVSSGGGSDPEPEPTLVFHSKNAFLSESEMQENAKYIYAKLSKNGWTLNAIAGMLGNMETESTINPGIWQNLDSGNTSLGYGLVQWTPATKYIDWCNDKGIEPSHMDSALARIEYEVKTPGLQWIATSSYNFSFEDFKKSTLSPEYLADAFLKNYERPADGEQPNRQTQARYWYDWLLENGGYIPTPTPSNKKKKGYKWVIFNPTH